MTWPSPQDYNEAVQNPAISFLDSELKSAIPECNHLGLPYSRSGAFASVYHLRDHDRDWAVRCFLHPLVDRRSRYEKISNFVTHDDLTYTVGFTFLDQGIRVHGTVFPLLKMEWVKGKPFGAYVRENHSNPESLLQVAAKVKLMVERLQEAGVAHGDLQHDNIMMNGDELILVDYDGLFVPSLKGMEASELGHRNYQHPKRDKTHFGPELDNFAAWVICLSLKCLAVDPSLWQKLQGGDDCLLFRQSDYQSPLQSKSFLTLESHESEEVRRASRYLRWLLSCEVNELPPVQEVIPNVAVPDLPGLDYEQQWWAEQIGTGSGAPPARIRQAPEQIEQDRGTEVEELEPIDFTEVDSYLLLDPRIYDRTKDEIDSQIQSQFLGPEQIVWRGGLNTGYVTWSRVAHIRRSYGMNDLVVMGISVVLLFILGMIWNGFGISIWLLCLYAFFMADTPCKHLWYGLTTDRLIVVYQVNTLIGKLPMRVLSVPLSEMIKVDLSPSNNSLVVTTRDEIPLNNNKKQNSITLFGLSGRDKSSFEAALPGSSYKKWNDCLLFVNQPPRASVSISAGTGSSGMQAINSSLAGSSSTSNLVSHHVEESPIADQLIELKKSVESGMAADEHLIWTGGEALSSSPLLLANKKREGGNTTVFIFLAIATFALMGLLFISALLVLYLVFSQGVPYAMNVLELGTRNCWYALTNKKLILVQCQPIFGGGYSLHTTLVPVSAIGDVLCIPEDETVVFKARKYFDLPDGTLSSQLRLDGVDASEIIKLNAALPSYINRN